MKAVKKALALGMAALLALSLSACGSSQGKSVTEESARDAAKWVYNEVGTSPKYGDEWAIIALTRSGYKSIFSRRMNTYQQNLDKYLAKNNGELGEKGVTDAAGYPRVVMALTSVGKIANRASGGDMVMGLSLQKLLDESGIYGSINALIAADTGNYAFHEGGDISREGLVASILSWQHQDGGFGYQGAEGDSDVDTTAMALQALSNYQTDEKVKAAVEKGLSYLEAQQQDNGGYAPYGAESCESASQVVIALTELGIDPTTFGKGDILGFIMGFQNKNGSFSMEKGGDANEITTVQALLALTSYNRMQEGKTSLYDMSDVYGTSHNKLSPFAQFGTKISMVLSGILIISMLVLFVRSRFILKKWHKEGVLDETGTSRLTEEELEEQRRARQLAALRGDLDEEAEEAEKEAEKADSEKEEDSPEEPKEKDD